MPQPSNAQVRAYWNVHIHDLDISKHRPGTPEFFRDLDEYHFEKLHHLPRLVDFAGHTVLEYLHGGHGVTTGTALEPVFLVGLALQVPLALAALLLARAALTWAERLGRGMTPRLRPRPPALASPAPPKLLIGTEHRPIVPALASGYAQRGPPAAVVR